jgi:hypothetical protein
VKVNLEDIKQIFNIVFDRAIELGFEELEIDTDYYWSINTESRTNFQIQRPELNVESLLEDYKTLEKILKGINPPTIIDFNRIGSVIIEIGNRIYDSENPYF